MHPQKISMPCRLPCVCNRRTIHENMNGRLLEMHTWAPFHVAAKHFHLFCSCSLPVCRERQPERRTYLVSVLG